MFFAEKSEDMMFEHDLPLPKQVAKALAVVFVMFKKVW